MVQAKLSRRRSCPPRATTGSDAVRKLHSTRSLRPSLRSEMNMSHASNGGGKALPMTVDKVSFLLVRLGQDCSPLQYLRELTQNAIEAVQRSGAPGQLMWDVDWVAYD